MKGDYAPALIRFSRGTRRRVHIAFALCCGFSLLWMLSGCTAERAGNGGNGKNGESGVKVTENTLRYPLTSEPTSLDPAVVQDGTTIDLLQNLYEGLVKWDEHSQLVPNIAEKWELSPDGTVYTFHLKPGVKFHNGREVTAADFKYSLERALNPDTKSQTASTYLKDIVGADDIINKKPGAIEVSGIKALDKTTLQITIDSFKPYWLGNMTYPCSYVVCKEAIEKNGGKADENATVGTGPFKLAEFRRGYQVVLAANADYHGGKPKLDYILRPIIKDGATRLNKYEAGELDIVSISPRDLDRIKDDPKMKDEVKAFPRARTWYVSLNSAPADSPFTKPLVRQAFALAIDRKEVVRVALRDQAQVAEGVLCPMPSYTPNFKPLSFDPVKAKATFAQAGYPDGKGFPALTLSFRNDTPEVVDAAQVIAAQLKANLGIEIQLRPTEWNTFLTERNQKTLALSFLSWGADYLDPQNFLSVLLHTSKKVNGVDDHPENGSNYSNPEFDKLCDQADVEHDPQKRQALYQQAEQIAINDAPWVPIYFQRDIELIKPRVGHLTDSLFGHLPHVTTTVSGE